MISGRLREALGVREADIRETGLPVEQVSCGVPFVIVPMTTRAAVDSAQPDPRLLNFEAYLFTMDDGNMSDSATTYSRMFAPHLGVPEDPATGSASGPLGAYLAKYSLVSPDKARRDDQPPGREDGPAELDSHFHRIGERPYFQGACGRHRGFVAEGTMEVED